MFVFHLSLNFNKILIHVHYLKYIPVFSSDAVMLKSVLQCFVGGSPRLPPTNLSVLKPSLSNA